VDPAFTVTELKCNVFGLVGGKVKQQGATTVQEAVNLPGGASAAGATYVTAFGWALSSTTAGTRGIATKGRMFLPAMGKSSTQTPQAFTESGTWDPTIVAAVSQQLTTAWDALQAASGTGPGAETFLPSMVALPNERAGTTEFTVNAADVTTAERTVWVVRTRKNALATGGTRTTHPAFA